MHIGYLLPGFSAHADDWAIPVQQRLVRELAATDRVTVLALRYPHTRQRYALEDAQIVPLGWTAQARGPDRLRLWQDARRTLERIHRESPFDVLHATWADETGLIAARNGRRLGIPSVVSAVGGEFVGLKAHSYGNQRSRFGRWVAQQALKADVVTAASHYLARQMRGFTARPIEILPLGVDATCFQPGGETGDPRLIVSAGSLVPVKDHATLIHALAQLPDARLELIGDGPERLRLEALTTSLGLADRVQFSGSVTYPEMPAHYQRAAIHAMPSLHEGEGMVTLEAAACAIPTIGAAVGLLADDPALGDAVPPGDVDALARALAALIDHSQARQAAGQRARARVLEAYTIEQTARRLREVYAEVIAWRKPGSN